MFLSKNSPKANAYAYKHFRVVLNEGSISQWVQFMVEVLMQVCKDKYKDNPILLEGLDLVPEEDQITHQVALEDGAISGTAYTHTWKNSKVRCIHFVWLRCRGHTKEDNTSGRGDCVAEGMHPSHAL